MRPLAAPTVRPMRAPLISGRNPDVLDPDAALASVLDRLADALRCNRRIGLTSWALAHTGQRARTRAHCIVIHPSDRAAIALRLSRRPIDSSRVKLTGASTQLHG